MEPTSPAPVILIITARPSPAQRAAYVWLWRRLLAPETESPTPAGKAEMGHDETAREGAPDLKVMPQ